MEFEGYRQRVHEAARLAEQGKHEEAIHVLQDILSLDLSAMDKAMMSLNIALSLSKLGRTEEALMWYDKGVEHEQTLGTCFVSERRAAYLAEKDRCHESLSSYQKLLSHPALTEGDKYRINHNIATLLERLT